MTEQVIYLYCFARADATPGLEGVGVDGQSSLFQHGFGAVAAVVSEVGLGEFSGPSAESRMKDLSWVAPRACRHEEVIEQVMRLSPVLPVRFGTVFSSRQSLEKPLQEHHDTISRFLEEVADKEEWVVKGLMDREKAKGGLCSRILKQKAGELASLSTGMRYLREQRIRAAAEKDLNGWLKQARQALAQDWQGCVTEFCERRLLPREITGMELDLVLNWALLVPRAVLPEFKIRIARAKADYAPQGLLLELSGPWPPYSFTPALETEPGP